MASLYSGFAFSMVIYILCTADFNECKILEVE